MDILLGVGAVLLGLLGGALIVQLIASRRIAVLRTDAATQLARAEHLAAELESARTSTTSEQEKSTALTAKLAAAETEGTNLRRQLEKEGLRLTEIETRFRSEFENLANRILEEKSTRFLSQNEKQLSALLDPLRLRLGEFKQRVETIHTEDTKTSAALREQLQHLRDLNRQMSDEASALTRALKGEAKTRGSWGELILERILEKSGLQKGVEYETQSSFRDEDGKNFLPDVVIHLPEGKHLIIDAKLSLVAYERFINADSDTEKSAALREHTAATRRHVEQLSSKDYPGLPELQSPDFVLMFVPVEPALHLALQEDQGLFSDAFDKNVVLVSSSTLLITLRAIESVWRRHKQTLNVLEIARQAGKLHDHFVLFAESLQGVGERLDQAKISYDQALARLSTGRGNLVRRVTELQKLGARTEKQMPDALREGAATDRAEPERPGFHSDEHVPDGTKPGSLSAGQPEG